MTEYVRNGEIDCILAEDTFRMGFQAVEQISDQWLGKRVPARTMLAPVLIVRSNVDSPEVQLLTRMDWFDRK